MSKPTFVISCPFDTYSGYGGRSRDIVKAIIELDKYDVKLLSQRWGSTSWGFCEHHKEWNFLYNHQIMKLESKPDIWMQITIPNEFSPVGKFNIGCTAGIEASACKGEWIAGLNRMDLNFGSSNFTVNMFKGVKFEQRNKQNQPIGELKLEKPMEVVFEGVNTNIYKPLKNSELKTFDFSDIKEDFCFLFVGHWMKGDFGHDRKNVSLLVKAFYETFKNKKKQPALILKASTGVAGYMSRDDILNRIKGLRKSVDTNRVPNVYVLDGEFTDSEMNELYNNPKIKSMVSFTKGEGFGRPLLEFSTTGKLVIASGWSGHTDFLNGEFSVLLPGKLEKVHPSAANDWLIQEAEWFAVDGNAIGTVFNDVFKNYKKYISRGKRQKYYSIKNFSYDKMKELLGKILEEKIPEFPKEVTLSLPELNIPKL